MHVHCGLIHRRRRARAVQPDRVGGEFYSVGRVVKHWFTNLLFPASSKPSRLRYENSVDQSLMRRIEERRRELEERGVQPFQKNRPRGERGPSG